MLLFIGLSALPVSSQPYPDTLHPKRLQRLAITEGAAYGTLLLGLNELWYKEQKRSSFHFFNDTKQWLLIDKAGHAYSTYQLSRIQYQALRWSGLSADKAAAWSTLSGILWMLPIEVLDGFSAAYGASAADLVANSSGALLFGAQQLLWKEQRLYPKFSFHTSKWAAIRPALLGRNFTEQLLKDYNGQTYWISADMHRLGLNKWPGWLNLAAGYGASGMVYADPDQNTANGYTHYPQFFLSPDVNLRHIKTNKKAVRLLLFILQGIHLPAPALEFSQNKVYFHPLYF